MKLLTKNKQDELLKHVATCQIICNKYINDIEAMEKMTENLASLAIKIGGCSGATKVLNEFRNYGKEK